MTSSSALFRRPLDFAGNSVRTENGHRAGWDLGDILDKHGAAGAQAVDDVTVVHDFVAHIDGGAILRQGALDDVYRPHNARTETSWSRKNYTELCQVSGHRPS